ncbi:hypothetical protein TIFTF001_051544, partial [Ficus carica]
MATVKTIKLGSQGLEVSAQGLGSQSKVQLQSKALSPNPSWNQNTFSYQHIEEDAIPCLFCQLSNFYGRHFWLLNEHDTASHLLLKCTTLVPRSNQLEQVFDEMATVRRIKLGSQGLEVSAQGLGCMGMSAFYGPPKPEPDMIALIHHAVHTGVTFLDTSDIYGPFTNEILLGK